MKVVFVSALLFVRSLLAAGADAGEIDGRVLNAQGAALPGAEVTVAEKSGDGRWNAVTGPDGSYSIGGLRSGLYTVTVFPGSGQAALRRQVSLGEAPARADFRVPAAAQQLAGADKRNPNIFVYRIDLNDLRNRLTLLRGADATYLRELRPAENYFGAEFGAPLFGGTHGHLPLEFSGWCAHKIASMNFGLWRACAGKIKAGKVQRKLSHLFIFLN